MQPADVPLLAPALTAKICLNFRSARMSRPIGRSSPPQYILQVQSCAAFHKQPDHFVVPSTSSLVQRRRVRMASDRVVTVWIFAGVQQQSNNLNVPKTRRQSERQVSVLSAGACKQPAGVLAAPQRCCRWQIHSSAANQQGLHRLKLAMQGCCVYSAVGIRSAIAQKVD